MNQRIRDALCDMGHEEAVIFDGPDFDEAIVGVTDESQAVYDYDKMVQILVERDGMDEMEAVEFIKTTPSERFRMPVNTPQSSCPDCD